MISAFVSRFRAVMLLCLLCVLNPLSAQTSDEVSQLRERQALVQQQQLLLQQQQLSQQQKLQPALPLQQQEPSDQKQTYVRSRLRMLEQALTEKTRREIVAEQGRAAAATGKAQIDKPYQERLAEPERTSPAMDRAELERRVQAKLGSEVVLEPYGQAFFREGEQISAPQETVSAPSGYVLGPGDSLKIIVWSEMGDETVYDVTVNPEGQVYIPILGVLGVSGLTVAQFEETVMGSLSGKFKHFKGQVTLSKVRQLQIFAVGEVVRPGAMVVSALATAFTALYRAGGPNERGSMRRIRIVRNNSTVAEIDLYRYFLQGDKSQDLNLHNGDTVFVPSLRDQVSVKGAVVRPGKYELLQETSLDEVIRLAGGLDPAANARRIKVYRWHGTTQRMIHDVPAAPKAGSLPGFQIAAGDEILVERALEELGNMVRIEGSVLRPGEYAVQAGLRVSGLIRTAGGLNREEASSFAGQIIRKLQNGKERILAFHLGKAVQGDPEHDLALEPLDVVRVYASRELEADIRTVTIAGAVRRPGEYVYREGMRLRDLLIRAHGLGADASGEVEVARSFGREDTEIQRVELSALDGKSSENDNLALLPLDRINVLARGDTMIEPEVVVIQGEVKRPGPYALKFRGERLSSVIARAGGLTGRGFPTGTVFLRRLKAILPDRHFEAAERVRTELYEQASMDLKADLMRAGAKISELSPAVAAGVKSESAAEEVSLGLMTEDLDKASLPSKAAREETSSFGTAGLEMRGRGMRDDLVRIPIDLEGILGRHQGEVEDVVLRDGDRISVPVRPDTISVAGAVVNPATILYRPNQSARYYINRAGGFSSHSNHARTVIVRANGEVMPLRRVRHIQEGDIILVPPRPNLVRKDKMQQTSQLAQILGNLAVVYKVVSDTK